MPTEDDQEVLAKAAEADQLMMDLIFVGQPDGITDAFSEMPKKFFFNMYPELQGLKPHLTLLDDLLQQILIRTNQETPRNIFNRNAYVLTLLTLQKEEYFIEKRKPYSASTNKLFGSHKGLYKAMQNAIQNSLDPTAPKVLPSDRLPANKREGVHDAFNRERKSDYTILPEAMTILFDVHWCISELLMHYLTGDVKHKQAYLQELTPYFEAIGSFYGGQRKVVADQIIQLATA